MKKFLPLALGIAAGVGLLGKFAFQAPQASYQPRIVAQGENGNEPYSMRWAKIDLLTGKYDPGLRNKVFSTMLNRADRSGALGLEFANYGPDNVGGRTRAILELYGKPDTMLVGSVTGGLFVSYDAGATWQPHNQFQNLDSSSSIISCIHQDTITRKIYVGTGSSFDEYGNQAGIAWPGFGIYVSEDEGVTFTHLSATTPDNRFSTGGNSWLAVNRIRTDIEGNIYAATEMGLKKSSDGGASWEDVVFIDPNQTIPSSARFADVATTGDGKVIASTATGPVYVSPDGEAGTFVQVNSGGLPASARRTVLAVTPQDDDMIYVMFINSNACLDGIYQSTNGGETWSRLLAPHDNFVPMAQGTVCDGANIGQGVYDAALGVSPLDKNTIFIGGVELWRYDGNLTRIATEGGQPPFQDVMPNYVHADKHYVYFSPNDPSRMYVTSDGGIAMSVNRGNTWTGLNKGYVSTQLYSVAHANDLSLVMGGSQDNGTLIVLGDNENDPKVGYSVFGNDGIDCDMSQISQIVFASSQEGLVVRVDAGQRNGTSFAAGFLSGMGSGGPFHTVVKLWENPNDLTSKDSIEFSVDNSEIALAVSNGIIRNYNETVYPLQSSAIVIPSTIQVYSGDQELIIAADETTLVGDGEGSIAFNADGSFEVNVTFTKAPAENSNIYVSFDQRFEANSVIVLESGNLNSGLTSYAFEHRLENDLNPGDLLKVQDPVQSLLAVNSFGGLSIYRNVLNFLKTPVPITINNINGTVTCVEFANDGNHAFVGTSSGTVFRISGLNNLYTAADADDLDIQTLNGASMGGGGVTGLAIDPNDNNRLIVTGGGYNVSDRVKLTTNALAASPTFVNVHGNLPPMPVYDAEIDRNDPGIVLLGTEFGIWATANVNDGIATSWSDENSALSYIPVYDVRQQSLPWDRAKNSGVYFIGSHGRGFWESTSLVGLPELDPAPTSKDAISNFRIYPNPMMGQGYMEFNSSVSGMVTLKVYDINGRQVKAWQERVAAGTNKLSINMGLVQSGTYYATLENGNSRSVAKFMVLR